MYFDWLKPLRSLRFRRACSPLGPVASLEQRVLLSAVGTEFRVNSTTGPDQTFPSVAMNASGASVVVWTSVGQDGDSSGVYAQLYNAAGVAQGSEFRVNTYTTGPQENPVIAIDANGDFVVAWSSSGEDGNSWGIYAQRFNASGVPQGSEFRVNSFTTGNQSGPSIAIDSDGDFVITWSSLGQDGSDWGVYAQRFNAIGVPQGSEFLVNTYTTNGQSDPAVSISASGDFVVTWIGAQDGDSNGIYAQRFNASGVPQGTEFRVNTFTTFNQRDPAVAMDADGDFVVAWRSGLQDGSGWGIYGQRYDMNGVAQGGEFQVNTYTTNDQADVSIAIDADGDFVVAWHSWYQDGSKFGIYAQRYLKSGASIGGEFRVNTTTVDYQETPSVTMNATGDFLVTWSGNGQGDGRGIFAQKFQANHPDDLGVWRSSKFYLDSNHSGTWNGTVDDTLNSFGATTDKPLTGDWNGDGYDEIGVWRNGTFYLDANGNGVWDGAAIDVRFSFGSSTDSPLVGDWNKDGTDEIGVWRAGKFYLDLNGNRAWNSGVDAVFSFGSTTDTPVIGDWNGDGFDDVGVWRSGKFYLDLNGNRAWNSGVDGVFAFGSATDTPLIGDWNGDGIDDIGVWRNGKFYMDSNGNRVWNSGVDQVVAFGAVSDTPLIGNWRPKIIPATPPTLLLSPLTFPSPNELSIQTAPTVTPEVLSSLIAPEKRRQMF